MKILNELSIRGGAVLRSLITSASHKCHVVAALDCLLLQKNNKKILLTLFSGLKAPIDLQLLAMMLIIELSSKWSICWIDRDSGLHRIQ